MVSASRWSTKEAVGEFARLLEEARIHGPQEILDETGVYVLQLREDYSKEDAARFLLRSKPTS